MGFDASSLRFLTSALRMGCPIGSVCTLGRQNLFVTPAQIESLLDEAGRRPADLWDRFDWRATSAFADDFFRLLGAETVDSLDYSDFEGATLTHDLNRPIPESLRNRFDLVVDGGTLEHVFHYPTALANAMQMTRTGGHLVLMTPANNLCGHGFYQFSPELFFRALTPENGFRLLRLFLISGGRTYHVIDPIAVHGRVELLGRDAAGIFAHAVKESDVEPFRTPPQQSDYDAAWTEAREAAPPEAGDGRVKRFLRKRLSPERIRDVSRHLNRLRQRRRAAEWRRSSRLSNRRWYVPVDRWDVPSASVFAPSAT